DPLNHKGEYCLPNFHSNKQVDFVIGRGQTRSCLDGVHDIYIEVIHLHMDHMECCND
ncbi:unnamed protein product, partial [Musa banksii]